MRVRSPLVNLGGGGTPRGWAIPTATDIAFAVAVLAVISSHLQALLGGIDFTVSLLSGELAFRAGSERDEHVKVGVFVASMLAATLAAILLRFRNRI